VSGRGSVEEGDLPMTATELLLEAMIHLCRLAGAGLLLYIAWEARRRPRGWLLAASLAGGLNLGLREGAHFLGLYSEAGAAQPSWDYPLPAVLDAISLAALLAWAISSSELRRRWIWISIGGLAGALALNHQQPQLRGELPSFAGGGMLALCGWLFGGPASRAQRQAVERRFFRAFGYACGLTAIPLLLPLREPYRASAFAAASLIMPVTFIVWMSRRNVFGMKPSWRFVFLGILGLLSAFYLLVVRRISDELFIAYGQSRSFIELLLIMAAAVFWLPIYEWMSRRLARRGELLADFSKKVIEQAAAKLDPQEQIGFLASGLLKTLGCRRLLLIGRGRGVRQGAAGPMRPLPESEAAAVLSRLEHCRDDLLHQTSAPDTVREWLDLHQFHYLVPLRHENKIAGALLLDVSPRRFLADIDPMFASMAREISLVLVSTELAGEKVEMEKSLAAQESRVVIGDLTATIVHEIKNPLSNIRALSQLVHEDAQVSARYGRDLEFIIQETDRLNASVMRLLEYAAQPAGAPADVDVSAVLERAARSIEIEGAASRLVIEKSIEPGLCMHAADQRGVEQVAMNLLRNAMQASPEGGRIRVEARRSGDSIRLAIWDSGPGIPDELREKIFQPYFTTKQSGTGLGLAIVTKNLRQLGGSLDLLSPLEGGFGSLFTVTLPVERRP
jgi:signal transduction histidine kinase